MAGCRYILLSAICVFFSLVRVVELSRNLSLNKSTTQSSNYSVDENSPIVHTSGNAVDGKTSQQLDQKSCVHQAEGQTEVWWRVDLQKEVTIENVEIYYREENSWTVWKDRFAGYEVYLSNTTARRREDRCFIDESQSVNEIESHVNHSECNGTAQYVTIYNHRESPKRQSWYSNDALLELCEVKVYGCEVGKYGSGNCDQTCSSSCRGGLCNPSSGHCLDCQDGYYGYRCESECSNTCGSNVCEKVTGYCTDCQDGYYGNRCESDCPNTCGSNVCEKVTGDCTDCQDGFYGLRCSIQCPANCSSNVCGKDHGYCTDCKDGYYGNQCLSPCPGSCGGSKVCNKDTGNCIDCQDGYFGDRCQYQCPVTCVNKVCDKDTGNCIVCPEGKYNQKCEQPCPYTCGNNSCEQKSGKCTDCNVGKYGPTCANCSVKCSAAKCDFDGQCTDGCVDGRYGDRCELPCLENCTSCARDGEQCLGCIDGMFGSSCSRECGQCVGQRCNKDTGHCETPCQMGWTGQRCEVKAEKQTEDDSSNVGTYVGVGGVSIFVVMIVTIAVVCIIKRKSSTSGETASSPSVAYGGPNPSNNSNRHSDETGGHVYLNLQDGSMPEQSENPENVYYNEGPVGFPVSMLKTLISEKMEDEEKKFISEFEAFPVGAIHPHAIAEKNKSKNRFKAIYPYDHSRVILNTIPGGNSSDYINANYIDSVEERKVYVATQGPLPSTTDDFWRMVWTINSGKIVMLTNLVESRKDKCEKYWPDEGDSMTTKTFDIMLNRERDYASHVVRNITVIDRKSKEKRDIHQFHFTTWPDHGTPNTLELVLFHRRVKLHKTTLPGQMVVHCSAGIGRTGTFIALDALLDFGKKYDRINIRHYVNMMRKDRMHMIQTEEQYVALHEILAEAFDLQDTLITKSMFVSKYHALSTTGQPQNQTQLRDEFKLMLDLKPDYKLEQDFLASTLPENKVKNRTMRILAADRFRAFLKSYPSNRNDYINAVITQSYTGRQGYIATQFPLPDTRTDFWNLVMDYQCYTIVILGEEKELDTQWIPDDRVVVDIGDFNVKQKGTATEFNGVDVTDVLVKKKNVKTTHSSRVFRLKEWTMEKQVPPSKQHILHLLEQVESRRRASGNKPVLITCKDGSTQCGLFCLMANTRDQIKMDEEVDVFQAARQLLIRRPEFLSSFEQYQFCYAILNDYLEATDVYIN